MNSAKDNGKSVVIGSRGSLLAMTQSEWVREKIRFFAMREKYGESYGCNLVVDWGVADELREEIERLEQVNKELRRRNQSLRAYQTLYKDLIKG